MDDWLLFDLRPVASITVIFRSVNNENWLNHVGSKWTSQNEGKSFDRLMKRGTQDRSVSFVL